jgi:hypothetical protein
MQIGSKLGHSKYQGNGPEKSTQKIGNKVCKLQSHLKQYGLLQNPSQKEVDQRRLPRKTDPSLVEDEAPFRNTFSLGESKKLGHGIRGD